jgi:hypothetical protein
MLSSTLQPNQLARSQHRSTLCCLPAVHLQGPLCQYALDALDAVIHFAANSQEMQSYQKQHGLQSSNPLSSSIAAAAAAGTGMSPLSAGTAVGSSGPAAAAAGPGVDVKGLAACLLPQLDVVELLQRVLDSCASPAKRRKFKLLPFLGDAVAAGHQTVDQDE